MLLLDFLKNKLRLIKTYRENVLETSQKFNTDCSFALL